MRELCGNITEEMQNTALHVAVFFIHTPKKGGASAVRDARRDLIRLLALGNALALQACHRVRDLDWLIDKGLLQRDSEEHRVLRQLNGPGYNEVFAWFIDRAYHYMESGMVDDKVFGSVMYQLRWSMLCASNSAEDLMMHLNQQIPLAYSHLLELMTKLYVLITPVALVPSLLWIAIPISPIVTLFFYGFFRLGTSMLADPFQRDYGFDTDSILGGCILSMESLEQNVPLEWAGRPPVMGGGGTSDPVGHAAEGSAAPSGCTEGSAKARGAPQHLAEAFFGEDGDLLASPLAGRATAQVQGGSSEAGGRSTSPDTE